MVDLEYCEETIIPYKFEPTYNTYCLRAGMALGKTKALEDLFEKKNYKKILMVSFRKSLDKTYINKFKDFKLYLDINEDVYDLDIHNKLVVQVDSLHKIRGSCDLLVLDEYTYTTFHLVDFVKERTQCYNTLKEYVKDTEHVIVLDAYLNRYHLEWFKQLGRKVYYVKNTFKKHKDKKVINYSNNIGSFINNIKENINNNKKIIICTNKKSFLNKIKDILDINYNNKKYKFIDSDSNGDIDMENWDKYDIIGYTPTIVAGVSFEKKHFDLCYGYFINSSSCAELSVQQLFRVRDLKDKTIHICVEVNGKKDYPTEREEVREYIINRNKNLSEGIDNLTLSRINRNIIEDDYFTMFINVQILLFQSNNYYEDKLLNLLEKQGIVNILKDKGSDADSKKYRKEINEISKKIKQRDIELMCTLPEIQFDEYEDLRKKSNKSKEEKLQIRYYNIKQNFNCSNLTPELVSKYEKYIKHFNNLKYVNSIKDNFNELISEKINDYEEKIGIENDNTKLLHVNNKYYKIAHLDRIVKELGFTTILDKEEIDIDKKNIINYMNLYKNKISNLFITNEINWQNTDLELLFKEILRYINQRLTSVFKLCIKQNKKNSKYYIDGLDFWCEEVNPFKITDIDILLNEILNEFKISQD